MPAWDCLPGAAGVRRLRRRVARCPPALAARRSPSLSASSAPLTPAPAVPASPARSALSSGSRLGKKAVSFHEEEEVLPPSEVVCDDAGGDGRDGAARLTGKGTTGADPVTLPVRREPGEKLGINFDCDSMIIGAVREDGPAARAGVEEGWKITKVDGARVADGYAFKDALDAAEADLQLTLQPPTWLVPTKLFDEDSDDDESGDDESDDESGAGEAPAPRRPPALDAVDAGRARG